jgi:hypothetical protein
MTVARPFKTPKRKQFSIERSPIPATVFLFDNFPLFARFFFRYEQHTDEVSIRKVLRPATSTQVFLGFPVSISKR